MNDETKRSDARSEIHPFPGLRAFEESEDFLFFGRDGQSEEILRAMRRSRLLAVVGASGSGKSSLVRAGLIPFLHGGFLAGARWRVAVMRPGADPIGALARAIVDQQLLAPKPEEPAEAHRRVLLTLATLRRGGLGLVETARLARLPEEEAVLIVVDQFEELFRFGEAAGARSADDAAAFVKMLIEATRQEQIPIYIVLTMRSDFIGDCARFRDLPETVTRGLYLVPRLTRAQRREVIEGPVRVGGGAVTPRLVTRVLNDIGDDPDQLPILQHAMMRAWDHWKARADPDRPLDLEDYEAIGGAAQALSNHADEIYAALDARGQEIARRMFQTLTEKDADNRESRRPTRLGAIAEVAGASVEETARVVESFRAPGQSFLMPPPTVPLEPDTAIDISHESLIRGWRRLRGWVDAEAESARVYKRLADTAALAAQGAAGLWRDPDLAVALAWREREKPTAAWALRYHSGWDAAMRFLDDSRAARDAAVRAEAEARRGQLRRTRAILVASVLGLLIFAGLSVLGYWEANRANDAASAATRAKQVAEDATRLANTEKANTEAALKKAESERARAELESRDLIADADRARAQELALASAVKNMASEGLFFAPPEAAGYFRDGQMEADRILGDLDSVRRETDEIARLGWHPAQTQADLLYVATMQGDAPIAIKEGKAYVMEYPNPIYFTDLAMDLTMIGDYAAALKAVDDAVAAKRAEHDAISQDIAPDIVAATHHRVINSDGDDMFISALYFKLFIYAAEDEDGFSGFSEALAAADAASAAAGASANPANAVNPYLLAIDHGWLAGRGQAVNLPKTSGAQHANYGLFAAQGAVWERAGAVQSRYLFAARRSYEAFEAAYAAAPQDRYRRFDAWVKERLARPEIRDAADEYVPPDASALALQADEIHNRAGGATYFEIKPALDRLSQAIDLLEQRNKAAQLVSQDRYFLSTLYVKRGQWLADAQDWGDAVADANRALALDDTSAAAYLVRGRGQTDLGKAVADFESAILILPGMWAPLVYLTNDFKETDPTRAIGYLEQRRKFGYLLWYDQETLADLDVKQKDFVGAAAAIAEAIALAPETAELCEKQRQIDVLAGRTAARAAARKASCLRADGDATARLGHSSNALKLYLQALRAAAAADSDPAGDADFEANASARALSGLLGAQFGADAAKMFWRSLAEGKDSLELNARASAELARLSAN